MFKGNALLKNISVLITGTVIAQIIPVALQPILKRLYTPEEFGVFDIYLKLLGILFVIFALKYDMAVVLPKNRIKALLILTLSVISAFFFTIITFVLLLIFETQIIDLLQFPDKYKLALYILPFSTLFFSLFNTFNYLLIRDERFYASSLNKVNRRSAEGAVQISLSFSTTIKTYGLFIGDIIGNFVYFLSSYYQSFKRFKIDKRFFNVKMLKSVAKEYSDLPKYNIIPDLLNSAFFAALSFSVLAKFNIKEVGYMELTQRILAIPSAFVAYSVGQVLLQRLTELVNNKEKISVELKNIFLLLLAMAIPFVIVILLFAKPLFTFVFGDEWAISGLYSKYLVAFYAIAFLISPLGQVLISLRKFKVNAIWKFGRFLIIMPLFFMTFKSIDSYLIIYSILGFVSYTVYMIIIFHHSIKYDKQL